MTVYSDMDSCLLDRKLNKTYPIIEYTKIHKTILTFSETNCFQFIQIRQTENIIMFTKEEYSKF